MGIIATLTGPRSGRRARPATGRLTGRGTARPETTGTTGARSDTAGKGHHPDAGSRRSDPQVVAAGDVHDRGVELLCVGEAR